MAAPNTAAAVAFDTTLNPRVAALKPSKTMALTDLATRLKEEGADIIGLAAGEPDVRQQSGIPSLLAYINASIAAKDPACAPAMLFRALPLSGRLSNCANP